MAADDASWTIDQLSELVARALSSGYAGQTNGRVRDVPDVRTIRWYTSIGLLDRPAAMRGRTALYGRRHLVQVVAVKRLQADGRSLADVQRELIGADDATLERIARLPRQSELSQLAEQSEPSEPSEPAIARPRFWSTPPRQHVQHETRHAAPQETLTRARTTTVSPSASLSSSAEKASPPPSAPTAVVQGIPLADDVVLLLSAAGRTPDASTIAAVRSAAEPLLDLLRTLGLSSS